MRCAEHFFELTTSERARVALARAVYAPSKVVILDDVLSAVDAHLARLIFDECLRGPLCRDRTIILVSHAIELCRPTASLVVHMADGEIVSKETREPVATDSAAVGEVAAADDGAVLEGKPARKFIEDEERAKGRVSFKVRWRHVPV